MSGCSGNCVHEYLFAWSTANDCSEGCDCDSYPIGPGSPGEIILVDCSIEPSEEPGPSPTARGTITWLHTREVAGAKDCILHRVSETEWSEYIYKGRNHPPRYTSFQLNSALFLKQFPVNTIVVLDENELVIGVGSLTPVGN